MNRSLIRVLLFGLGCSLVLGCVPHYSKYQYISFLDDEVIPVERGRARISGLKNHDEMPVKYILSRDDYQLYFETDLESYWPSVFISGISDGKEVFLEGENKSQCGGFYSFPYRDRLDGKMPRLRYEWSPPFLCPNVDPTSEDKLISVLVFDGKELIGRETLRFKLENSGWVVGSDAI